VCAVYIIAIYSYSTTDDEDLLVCMFSGDTVVNKGCGGGNPLLAYQYIARIGLVPWTAYPYEEKVLMIMMMMMEIGSDDDCDDDGDR